MRQTFTQLYLHLVWATWDRLPLITPELQGPIYSCIQAECADLRCEVLAIGGIEDHVHLLVRFPTTVTIAQIAKQVKGASSHLVAQKLDPMAGFKWQGAYGAFTVSRGDLDRVTRYIANQREHHRAESLMNELEAVYEYLDDETP